MMKSYFNAAGLFALLSPALALATPDHPSLREQYQVHGDPGIVMSMPAELSIKIIGPITDSTLASYRAMRPNYPFTTLVVDSGGGDVEAAMAIATDMRQHGLRLVVAGRCFSACANYLFAGAVHKVVLPGSLVAIHSNQIIYYMENGVVLAPQRHPQKLFRLDGNGTLKQQVARLAKIEDNFYRQTNVSRENYTLFDDYQIRKAHSLYAIKNPACRKIDFWVLSRSEMENMRIEGVDTAWMPQSPTEAATTAQSLGLNPATIFFGTGEQLNDACRKRA